MNKRFVFFWVLLFGINGVRAQELQCSVEVNTSRMKSRQSTDAQTIADLKAAITTFMNTTRWTNDFFAQEERIKCNLIFNVTESPAQNIFTGSTQFQVIRPVFNSDYETITFQFVDRDFAVSFTPEDRQMVFNEQGFTNNLTSTLAFYSLIALASDYDSFSSEGGTDYIARANNVVRIAASGGGGVAWTQQADRRSRYWVAENLQNPQYLPYRTGFYTYHRIVLDDFTNKTDEKRGMVLQYLKDLQAIRSVNQRAIIIDLFMDEKAQELVNIFSEAPTNERNEAYNLLIKLAPEKTELFRTLL